MDIQLSDHFTYKKLLKFAWPPISSMVFTSIYGIVDGYFVSNYVGETPFASLNLVMPFLMLLAGVGFMFGAGGSALVGFYLGMEEKEKANRYFSLVVYSAIVVGTILSIAGYIASPQISEILGADANMMPYCILYLRINMLGNIFFTVQQLFQTFLITAEKPKLGFRITIIAGVTNMILDFLLVGVLGCGLAGAAWATVISQGVGGIIPLFLFIFKKDWLIHLGKTRFEWKIIWKTCSNGISEFLSNVSSSIVGFLFNLQLMKYAGEDGVSAYGVIMYVTFIFVAIYIGYNMGVAPVVSFHQGAGNKDELKSLYRKSLTIMFVTNITMFAISELLAMPMAKLFVGYRPELCEMTANGLRIYSVAFLIMGFNFFGSSFFTALNNGVVSAVISVARTLVLQIIAIYLLPMIFGTNGLWGVVIFVDTIGFIITLIFLISMGNRYGYRTRNENSKKPRLKYIILILIICLGLFGGFCFFHFAWVATHTTNQTIDVGE